MKVDFKQSLDSYQARHREFRVLEVPPLDYLMVDGHGDPNTAPEYADAIGTLYPVAYAIKFASKRQLGRDYVVPPLEALWWAPDMAAFTTARDKSRWDWTVMIDGARLDHALHGRGRRSPRRGEVPPAGSTRSGWESLEEGRCVQTLHIGPYDDEAAVLAELHDEFIPGTGCG